MTVPLLQHVIIGGTIKAATSSLFNYFSEHPEVCGSRVKETYFFSQGYCGDDEQDSRRYAAFFSPQAGNRILLEASPNYLAYKENVAPRIRRLCPQAKLLFVLRNPVARLYSHYNFARGKLELPETLSFEEFVDACEAYNQGRTTAQQDGISETHLRALEIGNFGNYLENFYDAFDDRQIKVVFFENLNVAPLATLQEICEFIDVSPAFFEDYVMNRANVTFSAKFKAIHYIAILANRVLEPSLRRWPGLKRRLVAIYKFFNKSRRQQTPMREATRSRLVAYYAASNRKIKKRFAEQSLPPWLDKQLAEAAAQ